MSEKRFYLTKEGFETMKKEYETLKNLIIHKTQDESPNIWESEDVNPEYISFQEDLDILETKIADIENILKNAVIIEDYKKTEDKSLVGVGAVVVVDVDGKEEKFTIVGSSEASPDSGKISNESPVGIALLGRKVGDIVIVARKHYKIKSIKY